MYALRTPDPDVAGANMVVAYAHFSAGAGVVFQISPDRQFTPLAELLDQPPSRLGLVPGFDEHFVVLCSDRAAMRTAWSAKSQRDIVRAAPYARIASDGKTITFNSGDPIQPAEERAALTALAAVARQRVRTGPADEPQTDDERRRGLFRITVDGVAMWVNYTEPVSSRWPYPFTASATFELPGAPVFQISPDHGFHFLAAMLGYTDTDLGVDPAFDDQFIVRCDDADRVRAAMPATIMRDLVRRVPLARLTSDGATITLSSGNPVTTNQQMVAAVTAVATIARTDGFGFGAMRSLPGAQWVDAARAANDLGLPEVRFDVPAPIRMGMVQRGRRAVTRITGTAASAPAFSALVDDRGVVQGDVPAGAIPAHAIAHATRLRRTRLECQGDAVSLTWPDIERDPSRLHAGLRLVAAFYRGPDPRL